MHVHMPVLNLLLTVRVSHLSYSDRVIHVPWRKACPHQNYVTWLIHVQVRQFHHRYHIHLPLYFSSYHMTTFWQMDKKNGEILHCIKKYLKQASLNVRKQKAKLELDRDSWILLRCHWQVANRIKSSSCNRSKCINVWSVPSAGCLMFTIYVLLNLSVFYAFHCIS